ncbi:MAG: hypothetical protein JOZ05_23665, partial [Acetobacteraceae bacterium]|nr:hypothetical protein [Acetobacteraceae bacterium]
GFGRPVARQSYLWMAPFSEERMETLWTAGAPGETVRKAAFAPVDAAASEAAGTTDLDRLLHQFLVTYLPDDILMKTDRAAMFNSLEVRAPFLDAAVAEYAGALPSELKLRGNRRKYILKQVARKHLPDRLVDRKKHGFAVPIGHLLRTLFRECCRDIILSRANPVALWFDRPALERLLEEHMSGRREHGKGLWALLVLFMVAGRRTAPARHDAAPHALSPVRGI